MRDDHALLKHDRTPLHQSLLSTPDRLPFNLLPSALYLLLGAIASGICSLQCSQFYLIQTCLVMTIREELLHEIEQAPDSVLQALLTFLKLTMNQATPSMRVPSPHESSPGLQKHYPLRGLPLVIAEDFDAPMTDLWDSLES